MPSGNYLLRVETIGLHVAQTYPGAQFYSSCVQINVTGGGSATPTGVSFPGAYVGSDPGITINIYYPVPTTYDFPGGPTMDGSSMLSSKISSATNPFHFIPIGSTENDNDAGDWD